LRLREPQAAIDGDHLSLHPLGTRIGEPHDPSGHIIRLAAPLQRYPLTLLLLDGRSLSWGEPIIPVNAPDSVGPAATALTRTPRGASSSAQQRVRCSNAALLAA